LSRQRLGAREPEGENEETDADWLKRHRMIETEASSAETERKKRQRVRGRVCVLKKPWGIQVKPCCVETQFELTNCKKYALEDIIERSPLKARSGDIA